MPGFDRTGPEGKGSRTGRSLGRCNPNNNVSNADNPETDFPVGTGRGRGLGRGFAGGGRGAGRGRGFGAGRGRW